MVDQEIIKDTDWNNVKFFVEFIPLDLSICDLVDKCSIDFVCRHFTDVVNAHVELVALSKIYFTFCDSKLDRLKSKYILLNVY